MLSRTVLHVDDEQLDLMLVRRAFSKAAPRIALTQVDDGEQALEYLRGTGVYADRTAFPMPDLVLLDLKMPRLDGFDVLSMVRDDPSVPRIPIVVLTSSCVKADRLRAISLGATGYIEKNPYFEDLIKMVVTLLEEQTSPVEENEPHPLPQAARQ